MTHLNELYLILNKYLKWNKSHLKCFALIMLVIILKQTCNLSSASKALPIKCLPQSFYRRMQRFFAGQYFDYRKHPANTALPSDPISLNLVPT
ncbi:Transposase [Acinetobacter lwoffii]|nr:Transposase [Acinetobacter lwoffii]